MASVWIKVKDHDETEVCTHGVRNVDGLKKAAKKTVEPLLDNVSVVQMKLYISLAAFESGDEAQEGNKLATDSVQ
eukprot:293527-Amphidinium_carterae.1